MTAFCAQISRDVAEPLPGTGGHPGANLLLSWPFSRWSKTYNQAKDMTADEMGAIAALAKVGRRLNLIDRKAQPRTTHRAYLMPESRAFDVPRTELVAFLSALEAGQSLADWEASDIPDSVVLCCTHGKKDRCCAKFGNASYKALTAAAEARPETVEIWQSTHLGGCRLATSILVFPQARKYGRVDADMADAFLDAESNDRPFLPCYRGDRLLSPEQQVAEVAIRQHLAQQSIWPDKLEPESDTDLDGGRKTITLRWRSGSECGQLRVLLAPETVHRFGTCTAMDDGEEPVAHNTWQVVSVFAQDSLIALASQP